MFSHLLEAWRVARADRLPMTPAYPVALAPFAPNDADGLAGCALEVAVSAIGQGEEGGNNMGPFVAECIAPAKCPANWCAGFAHLCYHKAAVRCGVYLPFARSLGAKRLGENVAAVGRKFTDSCDARPGDLMVFHRGAKGSWMGHIALVEGAAPGGTVHTIEGNCGPTVRRRFRYVDRDRFAFFASLRRAPS